MAKYFVFENCFSYLESRPGPPRTPNTESLLAIVNTFQNNPPSYIIAGVLANQMDTTLSCIFQFLKFQELSYFENIFERLPLIFKGKGTCCLIALSLFHKNSFVLKSVSGYNKIIFQSISLTNLNTK